MPKDSPYFITGWPALISTMAKAKDNNSSQVERFELYMRGLEIANGYTELTDPAIQMKRFADDNQQRQKLGKAIFGIDDEFLSSLGDLTGSYTGVSIGIDRLLMALFKKTRIDEVLPARFTG
jgi:lysyl-tRNA synthetase class 2